ncbi:hypothetical protein IFO70_03965 [Phormidium tenue FACHB-886]|nr:hypothetical protein [Phormidium tenue FACHB-886]
MHYLEIGLLSLPVLCGLIYCLRDLRRMQNSETSTLANQSSVIPAVGDVDFGHLDPHVEQAASEAAHTVAVDVSQAIDHIGHWLHH